MPMVSGTIPHFVNGISQQPQELRLPTQADAQVNWYSTSSDGLRKRPPTIHVARLGAALGQNAFVHEINRDTSERYVVVFGANADLRVYSLDGTKKVVKFENAAAARYLRLGAASPIDKLRAVTVADYTFVLNTQVKAAMHPTVTAARPAEALISVKAGNYGRTYRVYVNGNKVASFETPDGDKAADARKIDTAYIARQLYEQLRKAGYNGGRWRCGLVGGETIWLRRVDSGDFKLRVDDGYNGTAMVGCKDVVQKFSDLPVQGPNGFTIEVAGDTDNGFDNYYVRFDGDGIQGNGVWNETRKGGLKNTIDPATMPHVLVRQADGTFLFKAASWVSRKVGDEDLNPPPSFIGRRISDVFFEANRLGLASDEGVVMSRAGEFFDFWRTTVVTLVDEDPIDVTATHTQVTLLEHVVPLNGDLILTSAQNQLRLSGGDLLTAKTVSIKPISGYTIQTSVRPAVSGSVMYLPTSAGRWTNILEYQVDKDTNTAFGDPITEHVPRYIPSPLRRLIAVPNFGLLFALSSRAPSKLYVYKHLTAERQRIQSAWSEWDFGSDANILSIVAIDDDLYLTVNRAGDGLYLETLPLEPAFRDEWTAGVAGALHLDRRVKSSDLPRTVLGAGTKLVRTNVRLPYLAGRMRNGAPITDYVGVTQAGDVIKPIAVNGYTIQFKGNWNSTPLWIGERIPSTYRLSTIWPRKQRDAGQGSTAVTAGKTQLLRISFEYAESSDFTVAVRCGKRAPRYFKCVAEDRWDPLAQTRSRLRSGTFTVPIHTANTEAEITITTKSVYQVRLLSAEWEATYTGRAQQI